MIPVYPIVFYAFSMIAIMAALMVIFSRNPVRSVLFLVLTFFCSAVLWMLLQAEFLSLVLIFVYVGAVMTLFLFVVMMINVDLSSVKEGFVRLMPLALLISVVLMAGLLMVLTHAHLPVFNHTMEPRPASYNNTMVLGMELFTHHLYALIVAAAILLVAMVSAIGLAFHGRKEGTLSQSIPHQHAVTKQDRLRLFNPKEDKE